MAKVLFYAQHLLGIGHLARAATLARGLVRGGFEVTLVNGGFPVPELSLSDIQIRQLPPTRATDLHFKVLVDEDGNPIDDVWKAERCRRLLSVAASERADVIITELYPFGRRQMRFELVPLLEQLRGQSPRPLIVSSVRDILVESPKPGRTDEMLERVRQFYDLVLVHGDPNLVPFSKTFPHAASIEDRLRYTGYVVEQSEDYASVVRGDEVLVSAGGGAVSAVLVEAALAGRELSVGRDRPWRVLIGSALPESDFARLAAMAPEGVVVERARPDFRRLLRSAALSISQGGYNTVMEVLDAKTPAVVIPYAGGLETEQTLRAALLADRGFISTVDEAVLSPQTLADAVDRTLERPAPGSTIDQGGVVNTVRILREALSSLSERATS
ncbi:MAG: glycosyltransferase [Pseudomonadota bacterium]